MQGENFVILILLCLFVNKLSEENERVSVAVHCNCIIVTLRKLVLNYIVNYV